MRVFMTTTLAAVAAILAAPAAAQAPSETARADLLQRVTACRSTPDDQARLACFDAATAALDAAERKGELVVMDQAQIQEAKRRAFGLELGSAFKVFERADGAPSEDVDAVTLTVARASRGADNLWVVTTADGQVWRQTEVGRGVKAPQAGAPVEIRRGALGSFFMKIDGQRAVRARREK